MEHHYEHEVQLLQAVRSKLQAAKLHGEEAANALNSLDISQILRGRSTRSAREEGEEQPGATRQWNEEVRAVSMVATICEVYDDLTPLELAIILRNTFDYDAKNVMNGVLYQFRHLAATEITAVMLNPEVCPELGTQPEEMAILLKNNAEVVYSSDEAYLALKNNYPAFDEPTLQGIIARVFGGRKPIARWAGSYRTDTRWWGDYFSPLVIGEDGVVTIQGVQVSYTYDDANGRFRFDRIAIGHGNCCGDFTFGDNGGKHFSGIIFPRLEDGPVEFSGRA